MRQQVSEKIDKINKVREELKAAEKSATTEILDLFKDTMRSNPLIEAVCWQQYVPRFNDGDPCEFSVAEIQFKFAESVRNAEKNKSDYDDDGDDDGFIPQWSVEKVLERYADVLNHEDAVKLKEAVEEVQAMFDSLSQMEDQLEDMFGSNAKVTVTAESAESEYYDCGY